MSCGSVTGTSAIPVTFPAVRPISADLPAIPWRAFLHGALAHAKFFAERRRQRLALLELDDRLLADIGLSRADARVEARKPFWH